MRNKVRPVLAIAVLAAVALVCNSIAKYGLETKHLGSFVLLSALSALVSFFPVPIAEGRAYHFAGNLFRYAAIMLLPLSWALLVPCIRVPAEACRRRSEQKKDLWAAPLWNAVTTVLLDALMYHALVCAKARPPHTSRDLWVFFGLMVVVEASHGVSILIWLSLNAHAPVLSAGMRPAPEGVVLEVALAFAGVFLARIWSTPHAAVLLILGTLLVSIRLLRLSAAALESILDPKTGLYNPRYLEKRLSKELGKTVRFQRPLSVLFADVDNLRQINNTHGHLMGDEVLNTVATVFKNARQSNVVASRFGGEEFVVLLIGISKVRAMRIAERLRRGIEAAKYPTVDGVNIRASISVGVATYPDDAISAQELLMVADEAMYEAKTLGKNRVQPAKALPRENRA